MIKGIDPGLLRLFFLSLLWRAAATDRAEFSQIDISPGDLEQLRLMLFDSNPAPLSFYPTELIQYSTAGIAHNHAPQKIIKMINKEPGKLYEIPVFRFYFDGLLAHTHQRRIPSDELTGWFGNSIVGRSDELAVPTIPFANSLQHESMKVAVVKSKSALEKRAKASKNSRDFT